MPPLAPNVSQAATLRAISGWNNSSMSRRSNTTRALLSTRTPQSSDTTSGGMLNPPLPPSIIREAMPRGAAGSFTPRVVLRRPSGPIALATFIGGWNDSNAATDYCIGQTEGVITTGIALIPEILYLWAVVPGTPNELSLRWAMGYNSTLGLSLYDVRSATNWADVTTILSATPTAVDDSEPSPTKLTFTGFLFSLELNNATVNCSLGRTPTEPPLPP